MRVRAFTVGPFQENTFLISRDGSDRAVLIDPGDEPDLLLGGIQQEGVTLDAILITHTDVDHVGAVAPVAKATGAPVYCPKLEVERLADIMAHVPYAYPGGPVIASGDVLFQSSVGRTYRATGAHETLLRSIATLLERYP